MKCINISLESLPLPQLLSLCPSLLQGTLAPPLSVTPTPSGCTSPMMGAPHGTGWKMDAGSSSLLVRDPSLWLSLNGAPLISSSGHVTGAQAGILITSPKNYQWWACSLNQGRRPYMPGWTRLRWCSVCSNTM